MTRRFQRWAGFTLVELMLVVAVVAVLAAVAYPSYTEYVARGHRKELQTQVAAAQQWLERRYSETYKYPSDTDFQNQAFSASPSKGASTVQYTLALSPSTDSQSYSLKASRGTSGSMKSDPCGDLVVNNLGEKSVEGLDSKGKYANSADAVAACWR